MAYSSVSTMEKPLPHLALADWHSRINSLRSVANARRKDAFAIRHSSRTLRNETKIAGQWIEKETNEALEDRIIELKRWRELIDRTFQRIIREIDLLREERNTTERELDALQVPLSIIGECLNMRDNRSGAELVYDDPDGEIRNELAVAENNQRLLADQCLKAWNKLRRLEDVRFRLNLEINNKAEAEALDADQLALNRYSSSISYKPGATHIPRDSSSYNAWLEHTKTMKELAENELADTYAIREALFVAREKARNMLLSAQERADHAIRKRLFETQRARNELEWQKLKLKEEMERAQCEIKKLEQALRDKTDSLKLAETRLSNRAQRSGMELCLDEAYQQLCLEVKKLNEIRNRLMEKIDEAKINFNLMAIHAKKIEVDLENKQHALMTDMRVVDLHARLEGGEFGANVNKQTERNIMLTRMENEIPKD